MSATAPPRVLVAHEEQAIRDAAMHAAQTAGYEVVGVGDGDSALAVLTSQPTPAALVVDVGLRGRAGYELVDEIRARGLITRTVLIASVYSKTAYKRRPTTLYGADDYVEQHHVVDMLAPKLAALVPSPRQPPRKSVHDFGSLSAEEQRKAEAVRRAGERRDARGDDGLADAAARARQLARIIVADVVLYNGTEVEGWLASDGDPATRRLPPRVLRDLDEARRMFKLGVARDVAGQRDFILESLMEFLARQEGRGQGEG